MADKISIDIGGETIEVTGGWSTEETLSQIQRLLSRKGDTFSRTIKGAEEAFGERSRKSVTRKAMEAGEELGTLSDETSNVNKGLKGLSSAMQGAAEIASGVLQSTGRLTDINPIIENVSGKLKALTAVIPEVKIFGFGADVGAAAQAAIGLARDFMQLSTTIGQRVLDAFDGLTAAGVGASYAYDQLGETLAKARISEEDMINAVNIASGAMVTLGGDLETGVTRFMDIVSVANNELRAEFRALGNSSAETTEFIASFIESQRGGLLLNKMSNEELAQAALTSSKQLSILAELTGEDVKELKAKFLQGQLTKGAQLDLALQEKAGAEGVVAAFDLVKSTLPASMAPVVDQLIKMDAAVGDFGVLNQFGNLIPELNKDLDNLRTATMTESERQEEATKIVERFNRNLAALDKESFEIGTYAMLTNSEVIDLIADLGIASTKTEARLDSLGDDRPGSATEKFEAQIVETTKVIKDGTGAIGAFAKSALAIEEATSAFTQVLFQQVQDFLPTIVSQIEMFYKMVGGTLGLPGYEIPEVGDGTANGGDGDPVGTGPINESDMFDIMKDVAERNGLTVGGNPMYATNNNGTMYKWDRALMQYSLLNKNKAQDNDPPFYKQAGGRVGGGMYIVGENGPELLRMDSGSTGHVYSNAVSKAMATPRYAGGPVLGNYGGAFSGASTSDGETKEATALPSMAKGSYTGTSNFANELKNGLMPMANIEMEMKAMRRDMKNLMTKVLTANGHF